ncbi:MAG: three-Cys-motif partner protein TcmP [Proteobacteria bacterium]|nr:three-Cys-motif partner protein TcmP [Pseudomonadota bacterium]
MLQFVGRAFTFVFVDPTGWKVDTKKIAPLLRHTPSEVVFNFMFDFANRFKGDPRVEISNSFTPIFANAEWRAEPDPEVTESQGFLDRFMSVLREQGNYKHVVPFEVLHGTSDRTKYFLVFGTRKFIGLKVFRDVQRTIVGLQETTRQASKQDDLFEATGQREFFSVGTVLAQPRTEAQHRVQLSQCKGSIIGALQQESPIEYMTLVAAALEKHEVTQSDVNKLLLELEAANQIEILGKGATDHVPKKGHQIALVGKQPPLLHPRQPFQGVRKFSLSLFGLGAAAALFLDDLGRGLR